MVPITLKVIDLITNPTGSTYRAAFKDLLRRHYLGENVSNLIYNLDYLYHLALNYHYYAALYGERRVLIEIFNVLGRIPGQRRLEILADIYRSDRTVVDDLFSELISFKRQLIRESAPVELVQMVNNVLASIGSKPDEVYRQIKHLVAMYDTWKEQGEDALEYLRVTLPGSAPRGGASDTELAKIVDFVLTSLSSGQRVTSTDIKRYVGDVRVGGLLINEAKRRGLIDYESSIRSFIPTRKGLDFIGKSGAVDIEELVMRLRR